MDLVNKFYSSVSQVQNPVMYEKSKYLFNFYLSQLSSSVQNVTNLLPGNPVNREFDQHELICTAGIGEFNFSVENFLINF